LEEYKKFTSGIDTMAPKLYRYLNFNELSSFTAKAATAPKVTAKGSLPLLQ
jgi:aconitase B